MADFATLCGFRISLSVPPPSSTRPDAAIPFVLGGFRSTPVPRESATARLALQTKLICDAMRSRLASRMRTKSFTERQKEREREREKWWR
ncbi:hypothetical protein PUN28_005558 [Cardiocondyla obscurior]|uniref:Uncharacterized protein n=1 Tax=Cardiocondyla obscurior TaxID=286306 RepID=A0AAW2GI52_9HYME